MKIIIDKTVKPKYPLGISTIFLDHVHIEKCKCGSSLNPFEGGKCIQPNCDNYYRGFPSNDLYTNCAVYMNGVIEYQWRIE